MACPDCGSSLGEFRMATSIETHGLDCGPFERFDEEFIVCRGCGGRFDPRDWEETAEEQYIPDCIDSPDEGDSVSGGELGVPDLADSPSAAPF